MKKQTLQLKSDLGDITNCLQTWDETQQLCYYQDVNVGITANSSGSANLILSLQSTEYNQTNLGGTSIILGKGHIISQSSSLSFIVGENNTVGPVTEAFITGSNNIVNLDDSYTLGGNGNIVGPILAESGLRGALSTSGSIGGDYFEFIS